MERSIQASNGHGHGEPASRLLPAQLPHSLAQMRPAILNPLFASVSTLAGVGPARVKTFARLLGGNGPAGPRVVDLLFHIPVNVLDRRLRPKLVEAPRDVLVMV